MKEKKIAKTGGVLVVRKKTAVAKKASAGVAAISAVDPQALLAQAIDKNLPIESMERLLAMRDKMKAEWARDQFFTALAGFQSECPIIGKNHQVKNKDKESIRYVYAAIEDLVEPVRDLFVKWGLSWTSKPTQTEKEVTANVYVHHKDGHEEMTSFSVPIDPEAYMSDPQKAAAALTFATRYAFKNAFGIQTKGEDNDAQRDDEPRRRGPIAPPKEKGAAVPAQYEEKPSAGPYAEIMHLLNTTERAPNLAQPVEIFKGQEKLDYKAQADQAKGKPGELATILEDMKAVALKRRRIIKGE